MIPNWQQIFSWRYSPNIPNQKDSIILFAHLENIIGDLNEVKDKIEDWDTTLFAVFYHDIIYKASSSTNEADSAKLAMQKLSEIGYPSKK